MVGGDFGGFYLGVVGEVEEVIVCGEVVVYVGDIEIKVV